MSRPPFRVAPLDATQHDRSAFDCASEPLNRYLQQQATREARRGFASCYLAAMDDDGIAGHYTLASSSVSPIDLPADTRKRLPC